MCDLPSAKGLYGKMINILLALLGSLVVVGIVILIQYIRAWGECKYFRGRLDECEENMRDWFDLVDAIEKDNNK